MKKFKHLLSTLAAPDRIMDILVKDRWGTQANPAVLAADEGYYFDRNGAMKINLQSEAVRRAFLENIRILASNKR